MTPRSFSALTRCVFAGALLLASTAGVAIGVGAVKPGRVEVELLSDDAPARAPGAPVRVGLRMKMDPGWHTYWKNPGDAGLPTKITWTLPRGWSAGDIEWPAPERIPVGPLASYGYEDEIVLPVLVFAPRDWDGRATRVEAKAEWLVCRESCIPESATVAVDVGGARPPSSARAKALFETARARQPQAARTLRASASRPAGRLELRLQPATSGQFFPDAEELVEPGDAPRVTIDGSTVTWSARLGAKGRAIAPGTPVRGVWVPSSGAPLLVDALLAQ